VSEKRYEVKIGRGRAYKDTALRKKMAGDLKKKRKGREDSRRGSRAMREKCR